MILVLVAIVGWAFLARRVALGVQRRRNGGRWTFWIAAIGFYFLPFADVPVGLSLAKLLASDLGHITIHRTVEADGFFVTSPNAFIAVRAYSTPPYSYEYIEFRIEARGGTSFPRFQETKVSSTFSVPSGFYRAEMVGRGLDSCEQAAKEERNDNVWYVLYSADEPGRSPQPGYCVAITQIDRPASRYHFGYRWEPLEVGLIRRLFNISAICRRALDSIAGEEIARECSVKYSPWFPLPIYGPMWTSPITGPFGISQVIIPRS